MDSDQLMKFYRIPRCVLLSSLQTVISHALSRNARYTIDMERWGIPYSYLDTLMKIHTGRSQGSRRWPTRTEPFRRVPEFLWGWLSVSKVWPTTFLGTNTFMSSDASQQQTRRGPSTVTEFEVQLSDMYVCTLSPPIHVFWFSCSYSGASIDVRSLIPVWYCTTHILPVQCEEEYPLRPLSRFWSSVWRWHSHMSCMWRCGRTGSQTAGILHGQKYCLRLFIRPI